MADYNEEEYRFEVPAEAFETVREELAGEYIELDVVNDREAFCVVKGQYSEYGDVLRDSVAHWERRGQRFFLLKDELAVKQAIERGAERLGDTEYVLGRYRGSVETLIRWYKHRAAYKG